MADSLPALNTRDAQSHPDPYRDLRVRVAAYSDYCVDLWIDVQDEVVARATQARFCPGLLIRAAKPAGASK